MRDTIANLITTHRGRMDDPNWLSHIEVADLTLQALEIEGWLIIKAETERKTAVALLRAEHALRTVQEFYRHQPVPAGWPADLIEGAQAQAKAALDVIATPQFGSSAVTGSGAVPAGAQSAVADGEAPNGSVHSEGDTA